MITPALIGRIHRVSIAYSTPALIPHTQPPLPMLTAMPQFCSVCVVFCVLLDETRWVVFMRHDYTSSHWAHSSGKHCLFDPGPYTSHSTASAYAHRHASILF